MFFQSPCIKQTLISITPFAARYKENHKNDTKGVCFRRRRMIFLRRAAPQKGNKLDTSAFILYIVKDKPAAKTERKSEHDLVLSDKGMPLGIYRKRTRAGLPGVRQAEPAPRDARAAEELRARTDGPAAAKDLLSARFRAERKRTSDAFLRFGSSFTVSLQLLTSVCFSPSLCRLPLILASAAGSSQSLCINAAVLKLHCASCYQTIKETLHHNSCTPFSVFVFLRSSFLISGIIIHRRGHKNKSQLL